MHLMTHKYQSLVWSKNITENSPLNCAIHSFYRAICLGMIMQAEVSSDIENFKHVENVLGLKYLWH